MKNIFKCFIFILAVLVFYACKKNKSTPLTPKDSDTVAIIKKMVGPHHWTGTYHSTRYDTINYPDTIRSISYDCPIVMLSGDSILFDSAVIVKRLEMLYFDTNYHFIQFEGDYSYPYYRPEVRSHTRLSYTYLTDTIYYSETYIYYPQNFSYEIKLHSP